MCPPTSSPHPIWHIPWFIPFSQTGNPVGRKMIPEGSRGVGGRLCPWSRCLTFAKPAKHLSPTPVRGEVRGAGQERGVRRGGQTTAGRGRSTGATCPQKNKPPVTRFHSEYHLFVRPSLPLSGRPPSFCVFTVCVHEHTIYSLSHFPFNSSLHLPFWVASLPHHNPPPPRLVGEVNAVLYVEGFECNLRS